MREFFGRIATKTSGWAGSYWAFLLAGTIVVVWALTGPIFGFSDTWQLVINTGTTIVTFLMVFLIQNSQNRESAATQIKLDEIIRALEGASNRLIDIEESSEDRLMRLKHLYERFNEADDQDDEAVEEIVKETLQTAAETADVAAQTAGVAAETVGVAADAAQTAQKTVAAAEQAARSNGDQKR